MRVNTTLKMCFAGLTASLATASAVAGNTGANCAGLPTHAQLKAALQQAVAEETSGFDLDMWATIVNRDGAVCAVAFSGADRGSQWPGSRVISAQKANTANAFSLDGLVLSTANLYSAVQPGGSLYGLQHSNPVDPAVAYGNNNSGGGGERGDVARYGQHNDPLVGDLIGGINVFGGGLALYRRDDAGVPRVIGGLGLSGDTSCADHMKAWRVRHSLGLDQLAGVNGVSGDPDRPDNIVFDITTDPNHTAGVSASGWGHPVCVNPGDPGGLPAVQ